MSDVIIAELPINRHNFKWWYGATVKRVVDGDSYVLDVDFGANRPQIDYHCRGYGYDTWETRRRPRGLTDPEWEEHKAKGKLATEYVESLIKEGDNIIVQTFRDKTGNFGRLLVRPYIPIQLEQWIDLPASLNVSGHLKPEKDFIPPEEKLW